jgi:hypothetical protein
MVKCKNSQILTGTLIERQQEVNREYVLVATHRRCKTIFTFCSNWMNNGLGAAMLVRYGMVAGGSGVTPMLNVIYHQVRKHEEQGTPMPDMVLMYSNRTFGDIILKVSYDAAAAADDDDDKPARPTWAVGVLSGLQDFETYNRGRPLRSIYQVR